MKDHYRSLNLFIALLSAALVTAQAPTFQWARQRSLSITFMAIDPQPPNLTAAHPQGGALLVGLVAWHRNWSSSSLGDLQWTHYQPDGTVEAEWITPGNALCRNVEYAEDGSIYAMGEFLDSLQLDDDHLLTSMTNELHTFLAHLEDDGNVLWVQDLTAAYGVSQPSGLDVSSVAEFHIGVHANGDGRVMHFDADGNLLGEIQQDVSIRSMDVDANGNVFVTGGCVPMSGGLFAGELFAPTVTGNGYNRYLARYTPEGEAVFVNFVGDVTCAYTEVKSDGSGGAYWAGDLIDEAQFGSTTLQGPSTGSTPAFHLVRVDADGNYLWALEGPAGTPDGAGMGRRQFLGVDASGNARVGGLMHGDLDWGGGITTTSVGYYGAFAASYAPDGELQWVKTANGSPGLQAQSLCIGDYGNTYLVGLGRDTCAFDMESTIGTQQVYPFIAQLGTELSTQVDAVSNVNGLVLYPDPVSDHLWITDVATPGARVQVIDVSGQVVNDLPRYSNAGMDVSLLAEGAYVLRITSGKEVRSARFLKR